MADEKKYTKVQFGQNIKVKYPQYKDVPDAELADKILAKYPQYKSTIIEKTVQPVEKKSPSQTVSSQPVSQRTEPSSASGIGYNWSGADIGATQVKMPTQAEQLKAVVDPQVYRVEQTDKLKNKAVEKQDNVAKAYKEFKVNANAVDLVDKLPEVAKIKEIDAQLAQLGTIDSEEKQAIYNSLVQTREALLNSDVDWNRLMFDNLPTEDLSEEKSPGSFGSQQEYLDYALRLEGAKRKNAEWQEKVNTTKHLFTPTNSESVDGISDVSKPSLRGVLQVANDASVNAGKLGEQIKKEQTEADLAIDTAQKLNKDKLEPLGFFGGFQKGLEQTTLANTVADLYFTNNDEQLAKSLENLYTEGVVFPQEQTALGSVGEVAGGQVKPLAVGLGTSAINPAAGVAITTGYYGRMGVGSGIIDAYTSARQQGMTSPDALAIAKKQAVAGGLGGLAEGAAGAITMGGKPLYELAKTPFKLAVKEALVDNGIDAVVAGVNQVVQNANIERLGLDRDLSEGVVQNMGAELLFGAGMNLGMYGGSRIKGYGTIINGLAKLPTAEIQLQVDNAVKEGTLDAARAEQFVNDIAQSKEAQEKLSAVEIPEQNEDAAITLQQEIDALEAKKKTASPAVLPAIETQIDTKVGELQGLLAIPLTADEKAELNRLQTARDSNNPYDAQKLDALQNRLQLNTEQNAVQEQETTESVLRDEGVQRESGLQGVEQQNQSEQTTNEGEVEEEITTQTTANENTTGSKVKDGTTEGATVLQDGADTPDANEESAANNAQVEATATEDIGTTVPISEPERVSGIKIALIPEEDAGKVDLQKRTVKQVLDLGKQVVDEGNLDARSFVEGISKGKARALQPTEVAAMVYYKTQLDNQLDAANKKLIDAVNAEDAEAQTIAQAEVDTLTGDLENYYAMSEKTAYEQGLAFRLRQMLLDSEYSLAKQVNKYKGKNKGVIPPEVEARFAELSKKLQDVESRLRIAEESRSAAEGQAAVQNIVDSVQQERRPSYAKRAKVIADNVRKLKFKPITFKDENGNDTPLVQNSIIPWNEIVEAAATAIEKTGRVADGVAEVVNNMRGVEAYQKLSDADKARLEQQIADYFTLSDNPKFEVVDGRLKVPPKLVRDLVESGVTEIDALTKRVHDMVKQDMPDVTEREVRDAITGYGKTVGLNKDEVSIALREAKSQGRLISALEDAENSLRPLKTGQQRDKQSAKVKELQKQVKEAMRKNGIEIERSQQSPEDKFRTALESFKTRTQTAIQDYERRLKEGDYIKEKRKPLDLDKEAQALAEERERIKYEFDVEQEKNRLNNRPLSEKITEGIADALNVPKSILASADFSAPLRQGAILSAGNPTKVPKAMYDMFRATFSKDYSEKMMANIRASKEYPLMKKAGLFLAEPSAKMSASEEQFISRLAERIPVIGTIIKQTGKGYNGYLNSLRASVFAKGVDTMQDSGFTPENDPQVFEAWAGFINNATGRGDLGGMEKNAAVLNAVLFSPRYLVSRVNLLNPAYYAKMPAPVRKEAAKNLAGYAIMLGIAYGLADAAGWGLEFDPRSADVLKIKKGETRYDPAAGFAQVIRFIAQLTTGQRKRTDTGEITNLSKAKDGEDKTKYNNMENRWTVIDNFLRSKYNPSLGAARNLLEGQDMMGDDVTIMSELKRNFVPLVAQGVLEKFEKDGIVGVLENVIPSMFGLGVQDYSIKEGKNKANEPSKKQPKASRSLIP